MNNIEKLAEPTEQEYLAHAEEEELLLFASEDDYLAIANGVWELFIKRAKALQSSEPVAEPFGYWHQGETYEESEFYLHSESGDVSCEHCTKLYTFPPSTVSLDEHNKRIAELEAMVNGFQELIGKRQPAKYREQIQTLQTTNKTLLDALKGMVKDVEFDELTEHLSTITNYNKAVQAIADAEEK